MFLCCSVQYNGASDVYDKVLKNLNIVFTTLFFMECILKIIAFGVLVSYRHTHTHAHTYRSTVTNLEMSSLSNKQISNQSVSVHFLTHTFFSRLAYYICLNLFFLYYSFISRLF